MSEFWGTCHEGQIVKSEELRAEDFGLENEIGEFAQRSEDHRSDERYFLKRTYDFTIFQRGEKVSYISAWVSFAKRTENDDWELVHECLTDQRLSGNARWIIYRSDNKK